MPNQEYGVDAGRQAAAGVHQQARLASRSAVMHGGKGVDLEAAVGWWLILGRKKQMARMAARGSEAVGACKKPKGEQGSRERGR